MVFMPGESVRSRAVRGSQRGCRDWRQAEPRPPSRGAATGDRRSRGLPAGVPRLATGGAAASRSARARARDLIRNVPRFVISARTMDVFPKLVESRWVWAMDDPGWPEVSTFRAGNALAPDRPRY